MGALGQDLTPRGGGGSHGPKELDNKLTAIPSWRWVLRGLWTEKYNPWVRNRKTTLGEFMMVIFHMWS